MFECHITIDPVEEKDREIVEKIAIRQRFRLAKLLMQNGSPSKLDTFITGHDEFKDALAVRMIVLCDYLKEAGFTIRRYKIEEIVLDSRDKDIYELLGDSYVRCT